MDNPSSHPFPKAGAASSADNKPATNGRTSTFSGPSRPWGSGNIWGNGGLTSGFTPRTTTTREHSSSRDGILPSASNSNGEVIEGKTGSSSLLGSSVSDDWSYRRAWGSKSSFSSAQSLSSTVGTESTATQDVHGRGIGLQQPVLGTSSTMSLFASRPQPVNVSVNSAAQSRANYESPFYSAASKTIDPAPTVYTKFDRPADPNARRLPDSGRVSLSTNPSPVEERKNSFAQIPNGGLSLPNSRNGSQTPARPADDRSLFAQQDYYRPYSRKSQSNSRTPSLSSQGNSYQSSYATSNTDALMCQLQQLAVNGDSRPSTSHKSGTNSSRLFAQSSSFYPNTFSPMDSNAHATAGAPQAQNGDGNRRQYSFGMSNGYTVPFQARHLPEWPPSTQHNSASLQISPVERFDQPQGFANGHPFGPWDPAPAHRASGTWSNLSAITPSQSRFAPISRGPQTYYDPPVQQMTSPPMRYQYVYSPYTLSNSMALGSTPPYYSYVPQRLTPVDPAIPFEETGTGESVQSSTMYRFKADSKSKHWEIKEIYGHVPEFSGDQHGSRFIQNKLETANSDEKEHIFHEIEPNAIPLMTDVFGNYVIQKFFEHGDQTHKKILANKMRGQVLNLSMQMYGCRVVQKALDHVLVDQQALLVRELEGHVMRCVKDQNGNHVIQKAIERCPADTIDFIFQAFHGQVQHLSVHAYGCRVIQRCLERCEPIAKASLMLELMDGIQQMVSDQYGNYVVQHVVEHGDAEARQHVLAIVARGLESYSKHKFASNVVEKCLTTADDEWRRLVIRVLADGDRSMCEGEGGLVGLIKDNFGNYVIQKLLDTLCFEDYGIFLDLLQPAMAQAKRSGCGKQVLSIEKKMQRFAHKGLQQQQQQPLQQASLQSHPQQRQNSISTGHSHSHPHSTFNPNTNANVSRLHGAVYQLGLPTPPFASQFTSAAGTPPPLTADSASLQSSAIPSINGDAVEGAATAAASALAAGALCKPGDGGAIEGHFVR